MTQYQISKVFLDEQEHERVKGLVSEILDEDHKEKMKLFREGDKSRFYLADTETKRNGNRIIYYLWINADDILKNVPVKSTIEELLGSTFIEKDKPPRMYSDD